LVARRGIIQAQVRYRNVEALRVAEGENSKVDVCCSWDKQLPTSKYYVQRMSCFHMENNTAQSNSQQQGNIFRALCAMFAVF
jgi:hypothetical protein